MHMPEFHWHVLTGVMVDFHKPGVQVFLGRVVRPGTHKGPPRPPSHPVPLHFGGRRPPTKRQRGTREGEARGNAKCSGTGRCGVVWGPCGCQARGKNLHVALTNLSGHASGFAGRRYNGGGHDKSAVIRINLTRWVWMIVGASVDEGRRATIKALPATPSHFRPYGC